MPVCAKWPLTCVQIVQKHAAIAKVIFKIRFDFSFNAEQVILSLISNKYYNV